MPTGATIKPAVLVVVACSTMMLLLASASSAGPGGRGLPARPAQAFFPAHAFSGPATPTHRAFAHRGRAFHGRRHDGRGHGVFGGFITSGPYNGFVDEVASPDYVAMPPLQCRRSEEIKVVPSEDGGTREIKITRSTCLP
jgi:hypothetical protein